MARKATRISGDIASTCRKCHRRYWISELVQMADLRGTKVLKCPACGESIGEAMSSRVENIRGRK